MLRKNVAGQFIYFAGINASTGAALTGATFSYRRSIDGTFAAGGGTITEDTGLGFYKCALSQADTNGNDLGFFFTATNAIPVCINVIATAADPTDAVRLGLSSLPNAAAEAAGGLYTRGTGTGQIAQDAAGNVRVNVDTIKTNAVVNGGTITFPTNATLASTTNITSATGITLTATTGLGNQTANITGTVTTVTNLTNAPTAGDLTATMKTSVENAVWDATAASHNTAGTTGNKLNSAASAGDPWVTALPGAYGAGSAGYIVGNNLNAAVGSVPTATQNADALLKRDMSAVTGESARSPLNALRFLRNKWSVSAGTLTVTKEDDATSAWTASISTDAAAVPIIGSDPA